MTIDGSLSRMAVELPPRGPRTPLRLDAAVAQAVGDLRAALRAAERARRALAEARRVNRPTAIDRAARVYHEAVAAVQVARRDLEALLADE